MKPRFLLLFIFFSIVSFGQNSSDYQEFLKEKIEASAPLDNYKYIVLFGNSDLFKVDAETFVGRRLTQKEFQSMMFFGTEIYVSDKRRRLFIEIIKSCDLSGIRKVGMTKSREKGIEFYSIKIYLNSGAIGANFSDPKKPVESIDNFIISVSCDKATAENIKNVIIRLAELNGSTNVLDGDNLFIHTSNNSSSKEKTPYQEFNKNYKSQQKTKSQKKTNSQQNNSPWLEEY